MQPVQSHRTHFHNSYSLLSYSSYAPETPHYFSAAQMSGGGYSDPRQQSSQSHPSSGSTYQHADGFASLQNQKPPATYQNPLLCQPYTPLHDPCPNSSVGYSNDSQLCSPAQQQPSTAFHGYDYVYDAPVTTACQLPSSVPYHPNTKSYPQSYGSHGMYDNNIADRYGSVQPQFVITPCAMLAVTNPDLAISDNSLPACGNPVLIGAAPVSAASFSASDTAGRPRHFVPQQASAEPTPQPSPSPSPAPTPTPILTPKTESPSSPRLKKRSQRRPPRDTPRAAPRVNQHKAIQRAVVEEIGFEPIDCNSISSHDKKRNYLVCLEDYVTFLHDQLRRVGATPRKLERVDKYPKGLSSRSIRTVHLYMRNLNKTMYQTLRENEEKYNRTLALAEQKMSLGSNPGFSSHSNSLAAPSMVM